MPSESMVLHEQKIVCFYGVSIRLRKCYKSRLCIMMGKSEATEFSSVHIV
jgi:hypothetical protein